MVKGRRDEAVNRYLGGHRPEGPRRLSLPEPDESIGRSGCDQVGVPAGREGGDPVAAVRCDRGTVSFRFGWRKRRGEGEVSQRAFGRRIGTHVRHGQRLGEAEHRCRKPTNTKLEHHYRQQFVSWCHQRGRRRRSRRRAASAAWLPPASFLWRATVRSCRPVNPRPTPPRSASPPHRCSRRGLRHPGHSKLAHQLKARHPGWHVDLGPGGGRTVENKLGVFRNLPEPDGPVRPSRRRDRHHATPPFLFSRLFDRDGEGVSAK